MREVKAYTWQHNFTGAQMFIYHKETQEQAYDTFVRSLPNLEIDKWSYIGIKYVLI